VDNTPESLPSSQGFDDMSLATLDAIRPTTTSRPRLAEAPEPTPQPVERPASRIRAVPEGTEARGFALYVGIDEAKALAAGTDLPQIVEALKQLARSLSMARSVSRGRTCLRRTTTAATICC